MVMTVVISYLGWINVSLFLISGFNSNSFMSFANLDNGHDKHLDIIHSHFFSAITLKYSPYIIQEHSLIRIAICWLFTAQLQFYHKLFYKIIFKNYLDSNNSTSLEAIKDLTDQKYLKELK